MGRVEGTLGHDLLRQGLHLLLQLGLLILQSLDHLEEELPVVFERLLLLLHLLELPSGPLALRRGLHEVGGPPVLHYKRVNK